PAVGLVLVREDQVQRLVDAQQVADALERVARQLAIEVALPAEEGGPAGAAQEQALLLGAPPPALADPEEGTQGGAGQIPAGGGGGGVCVLHGGGPEVDLRHMLVPIGTSVNGRSPVLGMRRMARCHHPPVSTCRDALPSKGTEQS